MPNAFTPNGDGLNDILYVRGTAFDNIETFQVYSRNGERVFESNDKNIGWDGFFNNNLVDTGVFVYFVEAICPVTGNRVRKQGNIMVFSELRCISQREKVIWNRLLSNLCNHFFVFIFKPSILKKTTMRHIKYTFIIIGLVLTAQTSFGQDVHFSQYYNAPLIT